MPTRNQRFDVRSIVLTAIVLLAAVAEPGRAFTGSESFGTWSDRFATHDTFTTPLVTGALVAVGGETVYSGTYRLEDGKWSALGGMTNVEIISMTASGIDVYVSGYSAAEGQGTFVAHWNGTAWTTIARHVNERIWAMAVHNGQLYVAGWFSGGENFPAQYVARWDGSTWTQIGDQPPAAMGLSFVGDTLYVAGGSSSSGYVSAWTGTAWKRVGSSDGRVEVLYTLGEDLYAGGRFKRMDNGQATSGIDARRIAKWNGLEWTPLGEGLGNNLSSATSGHYITSMTTLGSDLIVGGYFDRAGTTSAGGIARWDGERWSDFGSGTLEDVNSVASLGDELYIAGYGLERIDGATVVGYARWNGSSWAPIGDMGNSIERVISLRGHDDEIYAGGYFKTAGGTKADNLAKWDGVAWSEIGGGTDDWVHALAFDGDDLIAGGRFEHAGGHVTPKIARWNGTEWSALGNGPGGAVFGLLPVGDVLLACGSTLENVFPQPGFVASWDGDAWTTLGTVRGIVRAMAMYDGALYVGGDFSEIDGVAARGVARLKEGIWEALPPGFNRDVNELEVVDGELWAVGSFYQIDGFPFFAAAIWTGEEWISADAPFYVNGIEQLGGELYLSGQNLVRREGSEWAPVTSSYVGGLAALGTQLYVTGIAGDIGLGTRIEYIGALATGDCGNGVLDDGEQCDPAIDGTGGCCNMNDCSVAASGAICRPLRGPCDVAETCDGSTTLCPEDAIAEAGASCSEDPVPCLRQGLCDGDGISCPDEPCNDRDACNGEETCQDGTCSDGIAPDCDDDLTCTTDSCDADEGCVHEWTPGNGCAECGDVNQDGEINGTDALISLRGAVGIVGCPSYLCDYDGSSKLSAADSLRILKVGVGIEIAPLCPTAVE